MGLERIRNFYDSRSKTYGSTDVEGVRRYRAALSLANFDSRNAVLDLGCKLGVLHDLLGDSHIEHRYFGTDLTRNPGFVTADSCKHLVQADVMDGLPFQTTYFTHVFCLELLEHVTSPLFLLDEIYRVLQPGGQLLLSVPNPYYWAEVYGNLRGLSDTEGHISSFTPQNLQRLLGFASLSIKARCGTYIRVPFLHRVRSDSLVDMKPWLLARSVVYLAVKDFRASA